MSTGCHQQKSEFLKLESNRFGIWGAWPTRSSVYANRPSATRDTKTARTRHLKLGDRCGDRATFHVISWLGQKRCISTVVARILSKKSWKWKHRPHQARRRGGAKGAVPPLRISRGGHSPPPRISGKTFNPYAKNMIVSEEKSLNLMYWDTCRFKQS